MRGKVDIVTYMMTMLVMRREGVVRERKVVIDEERIMRRHHNTPKLARKDAGNRRRWRRSGFTHACCPMVWLSMRLRG